MNWDHVLMWWRRGVREKAYQQWPQLSEQQLDALGAAENATMMFDQLISYGILGNDAEAWARGLNPAMYILPGETI